MRWIVLAAVLLGTGPAAAEAVLRDVKDPMSDAQEVQLVIASKDGRASLILACSPTGRAGGTVYFSNRNPLREPGFKAEMRFDQDKSESVDFLTLGKGTTGYLAFPEKVRFDLNKLAQAKTEAERDKVLAPSRAASRAQFVAFAERVAGAQRILIRVTDVLRETHLFEFTPAGAKEKLPGLGRACYP